MRHSPRTALRRSLSFSTAEGVVAELVGACAGGGMLTAWALYLGLSPLLLGLLGALPFAAQLAQFPSAWIAKRLGCRNTALLAIGASRQLMLPLALVPFAALSGPACQAVLIAVAGASALFGVAGNHAWTSWMSQLVPGRIRGSYFGRRTAFCAVGATLGSLGAGLLLDRAAARGQSGAALSSLAFLSCVFGAATFLLLREQHDPEPPPRPVEIAGGDFLEAWRCPRARRALGFHVAWSAAGGIAAVFYPVHMIGTLRMGFARMALYTSASAGLRMLASHLWGRAVDRVGSRPVLLTCAFGLSLSPLLWLLPREGMLWPLAVDCALSGILLSGFNLASFALPIALSRPASRSYHLAAFAAAGGVATGLASALGGGVAHALPAQITLFGRSGCGAYVLFIAGACARFCAAVVALRIEEPGARPVAALGRLALASVARRTHLTHRAQGPKLEHVFRKPNFVRHAIRTH